MKKNRNSHSNIFVSHGYYFLHSCEIVLIGVKNSNKKSERLHYISKITNDLIFSKVGIQSQKPESIYQIIDEMMPGARKIELFAKNHNLHEGWLSLGNRLGENFELDSQIVYSCNECSCNIKPGESKRYKSKKKGGEDLCEKCFAKGKDSNDFFAFDNLIEEAVYHDWYSCDNCGQQPICGVRFSLMHSDDYDLCETCFDELILNNPTPKYDRSSFEAVEVPDQGAGFPVHHRIRCSGCHVIPIIGERFKCNDLCCRDINLCRNCFFKKKEMKDHKCTHSMDLIPEPSHRHATFNWYVFLPITFPNNLK